MKKVGLTLLTISFFALSFGLFAGCGCRYVDVAKREWAPQHVKPTEHKAHGKSGKAYHKAVKRQMKAKATAIEAVEKRGHRAGGMHGALFGEAVIIDMPGEVIIQTGDIVGDIL